MNREAQAAVKGWMRRKAVWGACVAVGVAISAMLLASCGSQVREGEAPSYLIITSFDGASGAKPSEFGNPLFSDVQTFVKPADFPCCPTFFNDLGRVTFQLAMKDPGVPSAPQAPTSNNFITVTRYRVVYVRSDGRNTPGVDVPHPIDGALTVTVSGSSQVPFDIVRNAAKIEPPLRALRFLGGAELIHAIAEVTFYGHDQTGRTVTVSARVNVNFADWGDPE